MPTPTPIDKTARCLHHLARARLLIDALAETETKHARALLIAAAELDQAAWQRHALISEA